MSVYMSRLNAKYGCPHILLQFFSCEMHPSLLAPSTTSATGYVRTLAQRMLPPLVSHNLSSIFSPFQHILHKGKSHIKNNIFKQLCHLYQTRHADK